MIPLPYNSDAPLYHWPIATAGLIVLNIALYCSVPFRYYLPGEHDFHDIQAQHDALAQREQDELEAENPADAAVEAINPNWGEAGGDWEQPEFDKVGQEGDGPGFQIVEIDRDAGSRFPAHTLALQHGKFKPWQWFTSMFMHYDPLQLILNMIALWAFGLIIEGKVGSFVFLVLYLAMGVTQAGIEQTLMLFSSSGSGTIGSTAAIMGALGIAVIWAPKNELDCFWAYGFRFGTVEIPILMYGFIVLIAQTLYAALLSYLSVSAIFQVIGLPLGCLLGFIWLNAKWVDCEGWDIVNVWKGNEGHVDKQIEMDNEAFQLVRSSLKSTGYENAAQTPEPAFMQPTPFAAAPEAEQFDGFFNSLSAATNTNIVAPLVESIAEVEKLIQSHQYVAAARMYQRVVTLEPDFRLSQTSLDLLMRGLLADKEYELAVPVMSEHVKRFREHRLTVQINLAKVLVHLQRPTQAIATLKGIDRQALNESQRVTFQKLAATAKKQLDEGVVEFQ